MSGSLRQAGIFKCLWPHWTQVASEQLHLSHSSSNVALSKCSYCAPSRLQAKVPEHSSNCVNERVQLPLGALWPANCAEQCPRVSWPDNLLGAPVRHCSCSGHLTKTNLLTSRLCAILSGVMLVATLGRIHLHCPSSLLQQSPPLAFGEFVESSRQLIFPNFPDSSCLAQQHEWQQEEQLPRADLHRVIVVVNCVVSCFQCHSCGLAEPSFQMSWATLEDLEPILELLLQIDVLPWGAVLWRRLILPVLNDVHVAWLCLDGFWADHASPCGRTKIRRRFL